MISIFYVIHNLARIIQGQRSLKEILSGTSDCEMYKDVKDGKEVIVCVIGKTLGLAEVTHDAKGNKMSAK